MNILLLTTGILKGDTIPPLDRLLGSLDRAINVLPNDKVRLILLVQNCPEGKLQSLAAGWPSFVAPISIPNIVSLSAARNVLLREAERGGDLKAADMVAYPDDDCWYPEETLRTIADRFRTCPDLDFLFCRYASKPLMGGIEAGMILPARARHVVRNASSNTIFFRGHIVRAIGGFDEMLGVGTPNNGGEDVEYAIRAFLKAQRTDYVNAEVVGHRDRDTGLRAKYYRGALLAIRRHAFEDTGVAWEYLRKIAVGLVLTLRGEVKLGEFIGSNLAVAGRSQ
jgi:hypothetical protein